MTLTLQTKNIQSFLAWVESCPFGYRITSMYNDTIHVKFFIKESREQHERR